VVAVSVSKDGRTTSQRKYDPLRREASRYGKIEKVLRDMKAEGVTRIYCQTVAKRVKICDTNQMKAIMRFTKGVRKGDLPGTFFYTDEEIRVDNE
jgi:hypothetical protein